MSIATFDTLKFANTLKAADLPPKQAEALAVAFAEVIQLNLKDLATKDDLKALEVATKQDLKSEAKDLRSEIKDLRTEMHAEFKAVRAEIKDVRAELKGSIAELKAEMRIMRWMLGAIGGGIVLIVGIALRFLFLHGGL
jgi:hypothetical protein